MAPQIERDPFKVFIAKLVVTCAGHHVWNIDGGQVHIVLDRVADFLQPPHLRALVLEVAD
jgi:hypothetical protein